MAKDPKVAEKLVRRTVMVGSLTAAYFLLTADASMDTIKRSMKSVESSVKNFISGIDDHAAGQETDHKEKPKNNSNGR